MKVWVPALSLLVIVAKENTMEVLGRKRYIFWNFNIWRIQILISFLNSYATYKKLYEIVATNLNYVDVNMLLHSESSSSVRPKIWLPPLCSHIGLDCTNYQTHSNGTPNWTTFLRCGLIKQRSLSLLLCWFCVSFRLKMNSRWKLVYLRRPIIFFPPPPKLLFSFDKSAPTISLQKFLVRLFL